MNCIFFKSSDDLCKIIHFKITNLAVKIKMVLFFNKWMIKNIREIKLKLIIMNIEY